MEEFNLAEYHSTWSKMYASTLSMIRDIYHGTCDKSLTDVYALIETVQYDVEILKKLADQVDQKLMNKES